MKYRLFILYIGLLMLSGCKYQPDKETVSSVTFITEYKNSYHEEGMLNYTRSTTFQLVNGQKKWDSSSSVLYTYGNGVLLREEQFNRDEKGDSILICITNYQSGSEEYIELEATDTVGYSLVEYNEKEQRIHEIKKRTFSAPSFEIETNVDFEEWLSYNSTGELIKSDFVDRISGNQKEVYYFYKGTPSASQNINVEWVYFIDENTGDTLITRRYTNSRLEETTKVVRKENTTMKMTFDKEGHLILSEESINKEDEYIEVLYLPEFNSTDSVYYKNGMQIKSVNTDPESKTVETIQYDEKGNKLYEERNITFYEDFF